MKLSSLPSKPQVARKSELSSSSSSSSPYCFAELNDQPFRRHQLSHHSKLAVVEFGVASCLVVAAFPGGDDVVEASFLDVAVVAASFDGADVAEAYLDSGAGLLDDVVVSFVDDGEASDCQRASVASCAEASLDHGEASQADA